MKRIMIVMSMMIVSSQVLAKDVSSDIQESLQADLATYSRVTCWMEVYRKRQNICISSKKVTS